MTARSITDRLVGLAFRGDHNPEQWDEPVRKDDGEHRRRARVKPTTPPLPTAPSAALLRINRTEPDAP